MAQDNANEPTVAEEPQASDQSHAKRVDPADTQTTAESQMAEPAMGVAEDDVAEEDVDAEEEVETTETESPSQDAATDVAPSSSAPPPTQSPADAGPDADERSEIEKQPYDFDHCTVQIAIQLLPHDGDANGRMVVVGVRSHLDTPILRLVRLNELGPLPPLVNELLDALKAELPAREQAAREAFEKKKEEKAKRKAGITASKTARGKKTKATAMATAPASSDANATDNRPRPEVKVTNAPQQQMGLF